MARKRSAELYADASTALARAAGHYQEAARHTELGEHTKAAQHAFIAHGHIVAARAKADEAASIEAEQHSGEVMQAHPVTPAPEEFPT